MSPQFVPPSWFDIDHHASRIRCRGVRAAASFLFHTRDPNTIVFVGSVLTATGDGGMYDRLFHERRLILRELDELHEIYEFGAQLTDSVQQANYLI